MCIELSQRVRYACFLRRQFIHQRYLVQTQTRKEIEGRRCKLQIVIIVVLFMQWFGRWLCAFAHACKSCGLATCRHHGQLLGGVHTGEPEKDSWVFLIAGVNGCLFFTYAQRRKGEGERAPSRQSSTNLSIFTQKSVMPPIMLALNIALETSSTVLPSLR